MKEFAESIKKGIENYNPNLQVEISSTQKNNGLNLTGLSIKDKEKASNVSPIIYLDQYFEAYNDNNATTEEIINHIIDLYRKHSNIPSFDANMFLDYNNVKDNLTVRLINYEKNKDRLKNIPHRMFLDLAITYYVEVDTSSFGDGSGFGSIAILNKHAENWGIYEEQLYKDAMSNLNKETFRISEITDLLRKMGQTRLSQKELDAIEDGVSMLVVTRQNALHGASAMLNNEVINKIYNELNEDFIIIPSSVHEIIVLKKDEVLNIMGGIKEISEFINYVNRTQLMPEEILSDSVYIYNSETKKVELAID